METKEQTGHITITAKKEGLETGYTVDVDYSAKSIKLSNKSGFAIFLPCKLIGIAFTGEIYWLQIPLWLFNKNYAFYNT
jgi:hypothetical protein